MNGVTNEKIPAKDFSLLKNWESAKMSKDTLYKKACPINICTTNQCKGSVMNPTHMVIDPRTLERTPDETHSLAKDFIDQYYESTKRSGSEVHLDRLDEVKKAIDKTGTYVLTEQELIYGAKMSWRNAPRCIGRIQWQKLHVVDCRNATTTMEMFQAICRQLKYATNNGNIRSAITMFPPRLDYRKEFRVWNAQLLRYAGYRQNDGSVIGDPASAEFTELCQRLGWKGKGTRFDVLPLVLQANGQDPDWYEIPQDLVLEVKIRHPEFKFFEELDLKWYAVPAVSNMLVDIGGVMFPGCPFNGWFMGTEIARDLCDVSRYNMLQSIAREMGLDTSNLSSFWKDKAMLQMNIAIIHSFQADRVTIMDHHVATESFMKHFNNELKLRNGCPGDWVWLVPPISGSTTPIFHQEILNYMLNPACYYQVDAWRYYAWKNPDLAQSKNKHVHFRGLARSVRMTTSLMAKAMAKRIKVTILYATETGKSQMYAELLQKLFNFAFNAEVVSMSEYNIWKLEFESLVLVVTSTFGNGDPPENGEELAELLLQRSRGELKLSNAKRRFSDFALPAPLNKRVSASRLPINNESFLKNQGDLANVKFSVFGLGSTAYPNFCEFAHAIDTMMGDMGAERLLEIGEGDELAGQEETFKEWAKNVFTTACGVFGIDNVIMNDANQALGLAAYDKSNFRVVVQDSNVQEKSLETSRKFATIPESPGELYALLPP